MGRDAVGSQTGILISLVILPFSTDNGNEA